MGRVLGWLMRVDNAELEMVRTLLEVCTGSDEAKVK